MTTEKIFYQLGFATFLAIISPLMTLLLIGMGIVSGLIVGWVLDDTWAKLMTETGWPLKAWQTGGVLAFIGGFFRPSVNLQKAED